MLRYYYILGGFSEELSLSELKALLETYDPTARITEKYARVCVAEHSREVAEKIARRTCCIREIGLVLGYDDVHKPTYDYISEVHGEYSWIKSLNPHSLHSSEFAEKYLRELSRLTGLPTEFRKGAYLRVVFSDERVIVGKPVYIPDTASFQQRKPSKRPFFRSIALTPAFSRLLVNLARVKEGEVLLDPFAGTGSILIEAGLMGVRGIGVDLDYVLVEGMKVNIEHYNLKAGSLILWGDSRELVYANVDGVSTDPPYGRSASTHGADVIEVYRRFLEKAKLSVKKRGYIVFIAPLNLEYVVDEMLCELGLIVRGKHYMYVHGALTRIIYEVLNPER